MRNEIRSAFEVVNGDALERIRFVVPRHGSAPAREPRHLTGSRVFDIALEGVAPGELLVVTCTDREVREALAADLAFRASRWLGCVLLGTHHASTTPLVDVLRAIEWQTSLPRARVGRRGRPRPASHLDAVSLQARITSGTTAEDCKLLIACDADEGTDSIAAWRELAQRRAVPIVVLVSGRIDGWAEPRDAHIDLFRTHYGARVRFIARGVPARSPESRRFAVVFDPVWGWLKTHAAAPLLDGVIERCAWVPEVGFDGVYRARPTLMSNAQLAACLADESWIPEDRHEALRVLEVVVAVMFQAAGDSSAVDAVSDERKRALVETCGGIDAMGEMYDAVGRDLAGTRWGDDGADTTLAPTWARERMSKQFDEALEELREKPRVRTYNLAALRAAMRSNVSIGKHGVSGKTSTMVAGVLSALGAAESDDEETET